MITRRCALVLLNEESIDYWRLLLHFSYFFSLDGLGHLGVLAALAVEGYADCSSLDLLLLHLVLLSYYRRADLNAGLALPLVVVNGLQNDWAHVSDARVCQKSQARDKPHKLAIVWVVVPTEDWDAVLRLKLVAVWAVVNDNGILESAANPHHVLDEEPVVEGAVLAKKPLWSHILLVKDVH